MPIHKKHPASFQISWLMQITMGTTATETLSVAGNIFVSQVGTAASCPQGGGPASPEPCFHQKSRSNLLPGSPGSWRRSFGKYTLCLGQAKEDDVCLVPPTTFYPR